MARPRNEELYNTIKHTAYTQLMTYGYAETTYQSIASACGVTRTAVQNYYPSKTDLGFAFFSDLLSCTLELVRKKGLHSSNEFDTMFCVGQCFFAFLMRDKESQKLLQDTVCSREISSQVLELEYNWGTNFLSPIYSVSDEKFRDDIIVSMGGFYELLYAYLKEGRTFDVGTHLGRVVRTIMHNYDYSYDEAKAFIEAHRMTDDERSEMVDAISEAMNL